MAAVVVIPVTLAVAYSQSGLQLTTDALPALALLAIGTILATGLGRVLYQRALTITDNNNGFVSVFFLLIPAFTCLLSLGMSPWIKELEFPVGPLFLLGLGLVAAPILVFLWQSQLSPQWWTVFNAEKAAEAATASQRLGRKQPFLARIRGENDQFYRGHEGGFPASEVVAVAAALDKIPGGRFAGITTFPALLFDAATRMVKPTPNLGTLRQASEMLARFGYKDVEINAPGTTSSVTLEALAEAGATQVEPGHGLTGTTPLHVSDDLPETPAVVYLTEISHLSGGEAFCFGGGLYIDPVFPNYPLRAIVAREPRADAAALRAVEIPTPDAIDYYGMIEAGGPAKPEPGDSVVFGFRPQAFVTRAFVAGVSGLATEKPVLESISHSSGAKAGRQ
jgi:predicted amino acid racemase